MTRRSLSRQEENKPQLALQELKVSKYLCTQQNNERGTNEKEILEVLKHHDKLTSQLSKLHVKYNVIEEERNRLQLLVDRFDDCSVEYEQTLRHNITLKLELGDAYQPIAELEEAAHSKITLHTHLV